MRSGSKRGFTLVEAIVAIALLGVGITAVLGALASLSKGESRAREQDLVQRLAESKYQEILATEADLNVPLSGDFSDQGLPNYDFEMTTEPTGVENLMAVAVRVTPADLADRVPTGEASGLAYAPPPTQGATQP